MGRRGSLGGCAIAIVLAGCSGGAPPSSTPAAEQPVVERPAEDDVMQVASIPSGSIEFRAAGAGEPVLMIHGALIADAFLPVFNAPRLQEQHRLILVHRRGYAGSSAVSGQISVADHVADCLALLKHLGLERAHIVGHSYGGAVALQLALDAPDVVQSLALLEPAYFSKTQGEPYKKTLRAAGDKYREIGGAIVDAFLRQRFVGDYRPRLDRLVPGGFDQAVADAGTFFEHELAPLLSWSVDARALAALKTPTLLVLGERSTTWPRLSETHEELLGVLPNAEGYVLPNAMHIQQVDNPGDLNERLSTFWSSHPFDRTSAAP